MLLPPKQLYTLLPLPDLSRRLVGQLVRASGWIASTSKYGELTSEVHLCGSSRVVEDTASAYFVDPCRDKLSFEMVESVCPDTPA